MHFICDSCLHLGGHQPISITENTSIDEFLTNAEAAQRSFEAERGSAAIAVSTIISKIRQAFPIEGDFGSILNTTP